MTTPDAHPLPDNTSTTQAPTASASARKLIAHTFETLLSAGPPTPSAQGVPVEVLAALDTVIGHTTKLSYRDALVVQLAFWLAHGRQTDITRRQDGGRGVSQSLGKLLKSKHIRAVDDAFQNIGKNTDHLARGNFKEFDLVLVWGSRAERTVHEIQAAFQYICARTADNARPVLPMPALDRGALTFARVCGLLSDLFDTPSGGAFEQFTVAALLHALVEQQGQTAYRVDTKNLNASDKSSRKAGDVQILLGSRVMEAFEITANDWREKLPGAAKTIRDNDLSRLTIVAGGVQATGDRLFDELKSLDVDVSVLEIKPFAFSMVSALTRPGRAAALQRLYELLDRYQPKVEIVNQLVNRVAELGLSETPHAVTL